MRLVAFDLETTGLDGQRARIIEFCFIELDAALAELARWTELVDPGMAIPADSVAVHGITDELVAGRPSFEAYAARIQALVQDAVLVAHNAKFDLEILSRELVRAGQRGLQPNHPCIDTQRIESLVNSHSLGDTLRRYTGVDIEGAHRSVADTAACVAVLRAQRARHLELLGSGLEDLIVANLERRLRPGAPQKQWLDHGRRFYADAQGSIRFGFGKHRDQPVVQFPDYLRWMAEADFADDTKTLVRKWLAPVAIPAASPVPAAPPVLPGASPPSTVGQPFGAPA